LIHLYGWQMRSLGVESVLVGDVVDGVPDVGLRVDVGEATADYKSFVFMTGVRQLGGLLMGLTVGQLVTKLVSINTDVVQWGFFHDDRLVVRGCCDDDGHEGAKSDDLQQESQLIDLLHDGWQMRSLGVESVLVGDVVDGVPDVGLRVDVGEATADYKSFVFMTGVHQLGGFLMGLAIGELVTILVSVETDVVQWGLFHDDRLVVVIRRSREGDGDDGGEGDDLK
ncbi:hypothetical protein ALC62_07505, partial [Cyphomyrmex costatus]